MNRIDEIFASLRGSGGRALMPYVTAGDPSLAATGALLKAIDGAGASVIEVGFPFSDPVADGQVIQDSMTWALDHGAKMSDLFAMVRGVRGELSCGLVAMVSYSIVHRRGLARFVDEAGASGFDGFILPDVSVDEAEAVMGPIRDAGLIASLLISPTTPLDRAKRIAQLCSGFVYVLARSGITGEQSALPGDLRERIASLRKVTDLPIAVGFGVSTAAQVSTVVESADAAIVGSAIMRQVAGLRGASLEELTSTVGGFVSELAGGLGGRVKQG